MIGVLTYEHIEELPIDLPTIYLDFSGNTDFRHQLHLWLDHQLVLSAQIGAADWSRNGPAQDLPGIQPTLFYAPARYEQLVEQVGEQQLNQDIAQSWHAFIGYAGEHFNIVENKGLNEIEAMYLKVLKGHFNPQHGFIGCFE